MDYEATLEHLYRLERFGIKLSLDNMRRLLSLLGDPQQGLRAVHVTGSNGKGSICAYVASALRKAGYRVGLYTSPHLVRFNERIQVDGAPIADRDVLRLWEAMQPAIQTMIAERAINRPTFFEVTTAMALQYFRERDVDLAVLEVGMGGRFDATNVVDGIVCVVGRIDLEHTEHLGKSVDRIAREKSGIIKPGARAVTLLQDVLPVVEARCRDVQVPLTVVGRDVLAERIAFDLEGQRIQVRGPFGTLEVWTPLLGPFQRENVGISVAVLAELRPFGVSVPDGAIREGIRETSWPGRMHLLQRDPVLLADAGHNAGAARALAEGVSELFPGRKARLVVGILADKDLGRMAAHLGPLASHVYACRPRSHRAYSAEEVAGAFRPFADVRVIPSVGLAVDAALAEASPDDVVLITGSIYTVGEAFAHLGIDPTPG